MGRLIQWLPLMAEFTQCKILANSNWKIVELVFHRKPQPVVRLSLKRAEEGGGAVTYDKAWEQMESQLTCNSVKHNQRGPAPGNSCASWARHSSAPSSTGWHPPGGAWQRAHDGYPDIRPPDHSSVDNWDNWSPVTRRDFSNKKSGSENCKIIVADWADERLSAESLQHNTPSLQTWLQHLLARAVPSLHQDNEEGFRAVSTVAAPLSSLCNIHSTW